MTAEERAHELLFDYCRHGGGENRRIAGYDCKACLTDQIRSAERAATMRERERICKILNDYAVNLGGSGPVKPLHRDHRGEDDVVRQAYIAAIRSDPTEDNQR